MLAYLFTLEWVVPHGRPSVIPLNVCTCLALSGQTTVLAHALPTASTGPHQTPFRWRLCRLAGAVKMKCADGRDTAFMTLFKMPSHYNVVRL